MKPPVMNINDVTLEDWGHGSSVKMCENAPEKYQAQLGKISEQLGARKLGYRLTVVPPQKAAYPAHAHLVNEEMFFIVNGQGVIRIGKDEYPVGPGDVIACPPGGKETAHQIFNTSKTEKLSFLAVSTKESPEIVVYPDSGKFGVMSAPQSNNQQDLGSRFMYLGDASKMLSYWDGE